MRLTRFEHRSQPIAPRAVFIQRLGFNVLVVLALIAVSLLVGMVGYRTTEGMGPVTDLVQPAAKYFCWPLRPLFRSHAGRRLGVDPRSGRPPCLPRPSYEGRPGGVGG